MPPSEIVSRMQTAAKAFENDEIGSRETLLELWGELRAELELPCQVISRLFYETHSLTACLEMAVETQLFQHLRDAEEGIKTEELAEKTGIAALLLTRIMRHFASSRIVKYCENNGWQATPLSNALAAEHYQNSILFCQRVVASSFKAYSEHFKKSDYQNPEQRNAPFQTAYNTSLPYFNWLQEMPGYIDQFSSLMNIYREGKVDWWSFYPVKERLIDGFDKTKGETLLVDIGGGRGRDVKSFAEAFWPVVGKLVLQDQPVVVASVAANGQFEAQAHDFFCPEPIQGARAYYLHSVLHDWSDDESVEILKNIKCAMTPGYSRILLNEITMDEGNPTLLDTAMDMMMLAHLGSAHERSRKEWDVIAQRAGFVIANVYSNPASPESVMELELRSD